ncbi:MULTISPECIES: hypothetical protein [Streptomyces]|uniref:Serine/threonine protein kinase n=1 Tax=Streptomyces lycii TaxID=2654337 RepID=A0ABQ7FDN2_9ACTN|nr:MULTISPECIES: hypothetical protein [Streptomyces]KAF4407111.1 hypothetical protein GCU69_21205 [Streptomyces lycii]PGH49171.1 hypothetical protein CRI70_19145 [Streptomyces sp. Ru87]
MRPRGRTGPLIACAAVLGVLTGVVIGYTVQYDRPPTPLPPLSQRELPQPEPLPESKQPEPLSAAQDRMVKTDGDLRRLLLKKPEGAQAVPGEVEGDWLSLAEYTQEFTEPSSLFLQLTGLHFRRTAGTSWERSDGSRVNIRLVQFRDAEQLSSSFFLQHQLSYMADAEYAGNEGKPVPQTLEGRYYVHDEPYREAGYEPVYAARALARRGDIVMDIAIADSKPVDDRTVLSLAERQLERL